MIVTRQRRKPFPWRRLILPLVAIVLVTFALVWAPSRAFVANGPLSPLWRATSPLASTLTQPFHFAAQNQIITERNARIVQLQKQVASLQQQSSAKDKTIVNLKTQLQQAQLQATQASPLPSAAPGKVASGTGAAGAFGSSGTAANDLAAGATPDMRRTAQYWANMEPSNAAKVIEKLPIGYSARILALMSPDAVGSILDALPAAYAAKLTQDHPELRK